MEYEPYRALYIHIPFCKRRCAYCDFHTCEIARDDPRQQRYVEGLIADIVHHAKAHEFSDLETIYIGGGTPSYLQPKLLTSLLYALSIFAPLPSQCEHAGEFTIEANPESITEAFVKDIFALGVNRLSIGVQSFDDTVLRLLGRVHDAEKAHDAILLAKRRFEAISLDLICGVPTQTETSWHETLAEAISSEANHISVYPLTLEPQTPLARAISSGELPPIDEDRQTEDLEYAEKALTSAGYARYETSNYAKAGFACRHNLAYWTSLPYLGLGESAVSMRQSETLRERIMDGAVIEHLNEAQMAAEDLMLRMRLAQGIDINDIREKAALLVGLHDTIEELVQLDLAFWDKGSLKPTHRGWLCGNEIFGRLLALAP